MDNTTLTDDLIAEIEAAAKECPHKEWRADALYAKAGHPKRLIATGGEDDLYVLFDANHHFAKDADANTRFVGLCNPANILSLITELRSLRADAERYRWLIEQGDSCQWMNIIKLDPDDYASLDAAIDTAMQASK